MQSDVKHTISKYDLKPIIIRSLRRSSIRRKVVIYLFEISPNWSYTADIAYNVKTPSHNIIGAIHGKNIQYSDDKSLISLHLVEQSFDLYKLIWFPPVVSNSIHSPNNSKYLCP